MSGSAHGDCIRRGDVADAKLHRLDTELHLCGRRTGAAAPLPVARPGAGPLDPSARLRAGSGRRRPLEGVDAVAELPVVFADRVQLLAQVGERALGAAGGPGPF